MRKIHAFSGLVLGLTAIGLASWWFLPPSTDAASVSSEKVGTPRKIGELETSLHLDEPRSILENLGANGKSKLDPPLLAKPSPSSTSAPVLKVPKALSRFGVEREGKGVIVKYKFKDASEQTKAAQAANPQATLPEKLK